MLSTISSPLGPLVVGLAQRGPITERMLLEHGRAFEQLLDALDMAAARDEIAVAAKPLYLAAIVLVDAADRIADRNLGWKLRRTVMRTFTLVGAYVTPADRALAARLIVEMPEPPPRAFAQA